MSFHWTSPASMQGTPPAAHWQQQLSAAVQSDPCRSTASPGPAAAVGSSALSTPGFAEAPARSARPVARIDPFRDQLSVPLTNDRTLVCPDTTAGMAVDHDALPLLEPGTTLVGIIDDGVAFASERFRRSATETRFVYMWQQNQPVETQDTCPTVPLGREISGAEIDAMLAAGLSEADIYATLGIGRIGQRRLLRQSNYGTSVADTIAGAPLGGEIGTKPAQNVRLLGVNLPDASIANAAETVIEPFMVLAVQRIMDHVAALEQKASAAAGTPVHFPLVLMLSVSIDEDGTQTPGPLPLMLRQIASDRDGLAPTHILSPTPGRHQSRSLLPAPNTGDGPYSFSVPAHSTQSTVLEISAREGIDALRASLQPPEPLTQQDGPPPLDVGQFALLTEKDAPERVIAAKYRSGARLMVMIAPTQPQGNGILGTAQSGQWQLHLDGKDAAEGVQVVLHRGNQAAESLGPLHAQTRLPRISVSSRTDTNADTGKNSLAVTIEQDLSDPVTLAREISCKSGGTAMATALATRRLIGAI